MTMSIRWLHHTLRCQGSLTTVFGTHYCSDLVVTCSAELLFVDTLQGKDFVLNLFADHRISLQLYEESYQSSSCHLLCPLSHIEAN